MSTTDRPAHGSPCNGCGVCCQTNLCPLGRSVFKRTEGPCPASEGARCGLVDRPREFAAVKTTRHGRAEMSAAAALLIGSGKGCDFALPGEKQDLMFEARMRTQDRRPFVEAAKLWGM